MQICKSLGLEHDGTKQRLNHVIEAYFQGHRIDPTPPRKAIRGQGALTVDTPLLRCGFSFHAQFRAYFGALTGVTPFRFTADMAAVWRKVKQDQDLTFTVQDMLRVYYGESDYARYDNTVCQWNQFLKDFCADENSRIDSNKVKAAAILWKEVRDSPGEKTYSRALWSTYADKMKDCL